MLDTVIRHANAMPAPTWYRLGMNHADIAVETASGRIRAASLDASGFVPDAAPDAFDAALRSMSPVPARPSAAPASDANDLDACALSRYQSDLVAREKRGDAASAFRTGAGADAAAFVAGLAPARTVLQTAPGATGARAFVRLEAHEGDVCANALDIVLAEDSVAEVSVLIDGTRAANGFLGSILRVFCGARSRLTLSTLQAGCADATVLDDTGCVLAEDASVDVRHFALSAGASYTGFSCDLRGEAARVGADVRYLGRGQADMDLNYVFEHRGPATISDLQANGVLAGESVKTLKATIDFIRGCKGASGHEQETALIAGEHAHNRSCPVILCGEDDVAGDHGASIGHIDADQMFYLASRGLSPDAAEALFSRSVLESALAACPDDEWRRAMERIADGALETKEDEGPCPACR